MKTTEYTNPWIDALRSGDYRQGLTFLYNDNKFCCLGVGLDVMGCEWVESPNSPGMFAPSDSPTSFSVLTPEQQRKLGISREEMVVLYEANDELLNSFDEIADAIEAGQLGLSHNDMDQLMSLNDEHGFSFSEIADVIEEAATSGRYIYEVCSDLAAFEQ